MQQSELRSVFLLASKETAWLSVPGPTRHVCALVADSRRGDRSRLAQTIRITNDEGDAILSAQWGAMAIRCKLACANYRTVAAGHSEWFAIRDKPFIAFPRCVYPASYDRLLAAARSAVSHSTSGRRPAPKRRSCRSCPRPWEPQA